MLALGASHLNLLLDGGTYNEAAIHHRVTAIKGLNKFLSSAHLNLHNADAAFAATLILAFQSYQMEEGLIEFLTMIRGCTCFLSLSRYMFSWQLANVFFFLNRLPGRCTRAGRFRTLTISHI